MIDLPVRFIDIRDEPHYELNGSVTVQKRATFYLGPFGPFTERMPNDDQFDMELARRVDLLKRKLQNLPT